VIVLWGALVVFCAVILAGFVASLLNTGGGDRPAELSEDDVKALLHPTGNVEVWRHDD